MRRYSLYLLTFLAIILLLSNCVGNVGEDKARLGEEVSLNIGQSILIVGEELTRDTFGDYVTIYNFKQSVDDGATVPLYYENRVPEVCLKNEELNEELERIIEGAMLDEEQERKVAREFGREYHIITRNDRLERIAEGHTYPEIARMLGKGVRSVNNAIQRARKKIAPYAIAYLSLP